MFLRRRAGSHWRLEPQFHTLAPLFGSLQAVFELRGQAVTHDRLADVIRIEHQGVGYYVKRYRVAGKGARRLLGRPRVQSEWENLQWFAAQRLPTATVVAYGLEKKLGLFQRGALVTLEVPGTRDLASLARADDPRLADRRWVDTVSRQVAHALRTMHDHGFIHGDMKWRNLLVDDQARLFLIDCPLGRIWRGHLFTHRVLKDFASLDRIGRYVLRRTQRLRFYLYYAGKTRLDAADKAFLRRLARRRERRISSFVSHATARRGAKNTA